LAVAKKKSRPSKAASAKGSIVGLSLALGAACLGGGYFAGKNSEKVERNLAALIDANNPGTPESQTPKPDAPRAVRDADKTEFARLLKGAVSRPPESKSGEASAAVNVVPTPPIKPERAAREAPQPAQLRTDVARLDASGSDSVKLDFPHPPAPIAFTFLDKEISESSDDARVTLSLNFENLAGKAIRAFEGVVKLTDRQDRKIYSSRIAVSALISEGGALRWDQQVDARKLDEKSRRLVSEDRENLKAVFQVKKVFFVDGSVRDFDARG
jgi:hypothetical protein